MASSLQRLNENVNLAAWAEMVRQCRESRLSVGAWCAKNGIPVSTYYTRQRKVCAAMEASATPEGFYEVQAATTSGTPAATVRFGELTAEIYNGAEDETVAAVVRALRSC